MTIRSKVPCVGLLAFLCAALAGAPALARDDCDAPVSRWQSREAALHVAAQQGWTVQRLKIDDGCYEIRGTDAEGRAFKAKVDPETLQVLKLKHRSRARKRRREHEPAAGTSSAPTHLTPGTAPGGQVD